MQFFSSRRWRAAAATTAAALLVLSGCSAPVESTYPGPDQLDAALPDATVAQMQAAVESAMASTGSTGAIVGVWLPWAGTWVTALGTQGVDDSTPVDIGMTFRVANTTRLMTCDVLYGMADDDLIELDAPVPEYVSGVPHLKEVTLLDLCNGTSGLAASRATVQGLILNTPEREWPPLELASFGLGVPPVPPGTKFTSSDSAYLLLGLALERASGMTAQQLIDEYVAEPLGLSATRLPSVAAAVPSGTHLRGNISPAVDGGFNCTVQTDYSKMSSSVGFTDAGVTSTIEDLGIYMQAMARQQLRESDAGKTRFDAPVPVSPGGEAWYQYTGGGYLVGSMIGQQGWMPGYATSAYSDPASGFTVAVVLNSSTAGSDTAAYLAWELAAIASKVPAAEGKTAPEFALPFTAEQYHDRIATSGICAAQ